MKFAITQTLSLDVLNKFKNQGNRIDIRLGEYLAERFASSDYGKGVSAIYAGLNCMNPEIMIEPKDFPTGFIVNKKYTKSKTVLEFEVILNHGEVSKANESQLIDVIGEALLKTYSEIELLNIKDFEIGKFYDDLKNLLQDRAWTTEPYVEKEFHYQPKRVRPVLRVPKKCQKVLFGNW